MYQKEVGENMEEKITLELTRDEIIMLQELTEDMEAGYLWMRDLAESLRKKALEAYRKPVISPEEIQKRLDAVRKVWKGTPVENHMVREAMQSIRFYNKVEEDEYEA